MAYTRFVIYNAFGALMWVGLFTFGGYYFGNFMVVKNNFSLMVVVIIILSLAPVLRELWKKRRIPA
jgi:membrane-associated protein